MSETNLDFSAMWRQAAAADSLPIVDVPAIPLARTVPMPERMGFPTGAVGIRFHKLRLSGLSDPANPAMLTTDGATARLALGLVRLRLEGEYSVDAKSDPVVTLDYGGGMRELAVEPQPAAGDEDGGSSGSGGNNEAWLDQARAQRPILAQSTSGTQLLTTYYANNYTFAELFQNNASVRNAWNQGNATTDMANDTYTAVGDNTSVINSSTKTYGNGQTYNGTAFTQQTQVAAACYLIYLQNNGSNPALAQRYLQAHSDTLNFSANVQNSTGNTSSATNEMTSPEVHGQVASTDPSSQIRLSDEQVHAIGRSLVQLPSGGGADAGAASAMLSISDADRARAHRMVELLHREWAEKSTVRGEPLYDGACFAEIGRVEAVLALSRSPESGAWTVRHVAVTLPAFDFQLDDAHWEGDAADEVRRLLPQVHFLQGILETAIVDALQPALAARAATAMLPVSAA